MRWFASYHRGVADTEARYERLLAHAREEVQTKERERALAVQRGDLLMDKLLSAAGVRGVSAITQEAARVDQETTRRFLANQDDHAFEEVPPGPGCQYASEDEALIDPLAVERQQVQ